MAPLSLFARPDFANASITPPRRSRKKLSPRLFSGPTFTLSVRAAS